MPLAPQSPDSLVAESHRQIQEAWRYFATQLPDGSVATSRGLLVTNGRSPLPFMNAAFLTEPVVDDADLRERLDCAAGEFRQYGVPSVFMIADDLLPAPIAANLGSVAGEFGLQHLMPMTGMVADALQPPVRALPALECRPVVDDQTRRAVGDINGAGYDMPGDLMNTAVAVPELWTDLVGVVGYVDGEPVSTASVARVDNVAYVCLVATCPGHQGKGYAEAVMRQALADARVRWGIERTVLHATPAGRPVYARMGYAPTNEFQVYIGAGAAG
jgi:GNAT superfamily N-acetyltransferase